ncbi:MAG: Wzt carbohydrate-binding domain-containing protein, partial [Planctomycetes bacterium]|nr:Wzt carbohydrate-binding domain-containing protein [Planctomycetota bacterium]
SGIATRALADRQDRTGNGCLRFVGVRLLDELGQDIPCLTTGRDAVMAIDYTCDRGKPPRQASISVGIDTSFGQRIAHLSSEAAGADLHPTPSGVGTVRIHLPRLALLPGRYSYTLFCEAGGGIADWVQNAGAVDVEAGDFFRSGKLPPSGLVCLECSFDSQEAVACC